MTPSKEAPRTSRGASARSEVNGKGKSITLSDPVFKGLRLQGPPILPATSSWDIAEIQRMEKRGQSYIGGLLQMIVSVVGEQQANLIRTRIEDKAPKTKDGGLALLDQVASDIINSYGITAGE